MHLTRLTAFVVLLGAAAWAPVRAAESDCSSPSPECAVVGKWEISASLGLGQRSNPVAGKSDIPLVVIPRISYYGKRFFLVNLDAGVTLFENRTHTFNLIATPGYDRVFFYRNDLQNIFVRGTTLGGSMAPSIPVAEREYEVRRRHTTYLAGPEWSFGHRSIAGQLNVLREVTGEHDGYEVRAALGAPVPGSNGALVASTGLTWKSAEIVGYYYGIDGLYDPGSALSPFVKLRYARPISERWTVHAFAHYERLGGAIANSPLLTESHVTTFFSGIVYRIR